jgi:hypothetical protein
MPPRPTPAARSIVAVALFTVALAALSCRSSDVTVPLGSIAYDVTTVLDTFYTEIGHTPDGSCQFMYCTLQRANSDGRLSGVVLLSGHPTSTSPGDVSGSFTGMFCSSADSSVPSACRKVAPVAIEYPTGAVLLGTPGQGADSVTIELKDDPTTFAHLYLSGRIVGDSIVGRVNWSLVSGRSPNRYSGTFVARPHR